MSDPGICPACDEPLNLKDPKWLDAKEVLDKLNKYSMTIDQYADLLGDVNDKGYHVDCFTDLFGPPVGGMASGRRRQD